MVFQKKVQSVREVVEVSTPTKSEEDNAAELVEVPSQYTSAFKEGEEVFDDRTMLLKIYNKLYQIEKAVK